MPSFLSLLIVYAVNRPRFLPVQSPTAFIILQTNLFLLHHIFGCFVTQTLNQREARLLLDSSTVHSNKVTLWAFIYISKCICTPNKKHLLISFLWLYNNNIYNKVMTFSLGDIRYPNKRVGIYWKHYACSLQSNIWNGLFTKKNPTKTKSSLSVRGSNINGRSLQCQWLSHLQP